MNTVAFYFNLLLDSSFYSLIKLSLPFAVVGLKLNLNVRSR